MYRLETKCTTKNESKKNVCALVYRPIEPLDLISSSLVTLHAMACKSCEV